MERRSILPERVLGRPEMKCTRAGRAMAPPASAFAAAQNDEVVDPARLELAPVAVFERFEAVELRLVEFFAELGRVFRAVGVEVAFGETRDELIASKYRTREVISQLAAEIR